MMGGGRYGNVRNLKFNVKNCQKLCKKILEDFPAVNPRELLYMYCIPLSVEGEPLGDVRERGKVY